MNASLLYNDFKERGVILEASGDKLLVDAPAGELTDEDKSALAESKPILLKFLSDRGELRNDGGPSMPGPADIPATRPCTIPFTMSGTTSRRGIATRP